jgi:three-Cys-motif partner protein
MPRSIGEWTKDKLKILELYLPGYLQATTAALDRIYVDAFSGPGTNRVDRTGEIVDGSPLIALKARAGNGRRFTRLYFIDNDSAAVSELRGHLQELDTEECCTVIEGDVNEELPNIFERINPRAPTFVFLDTAGIEPRWSTIEAISPWQVELLINFPLGMSINRAPLDSRKTLDYFGTEACLEILTRNDSERTRALLDLYKSRLKSLGFDHTTQVDRLITTQRNQRLYYLIFVSKVEPGESIMNWVFGRPDSSGQGRLGI